MFRIPQHVLTKQAQADICCCLLIIFANSLDQMFYFGRQVFFFFWNQIFQKILSGIPSRVSDSLDPDQAQHYVGPDLGPKCLQRLSADDTSRQM